MKTLEYEIKTLDKNRDGLQFVLMNFTSYLTKAGNNKVAMLNLEYSRKAQELLERLKAIDKSAQESKKEAYKLGAEIVEEIGESIEKA